MFYRVYYLDPETKAICFDSFRFYERTARARVKALQRLRLVAWVA